MQTCKKCNVVKEYEDFPIASITKSGRAGECKACKAERSKLLRQERAKKLYDMADGVCRDCGLHHENPSFFDFHHVLADKKTYELKTILGGSWQKVLDEHAKCVMLCPNCHRKRHIGENEDVF